MSNADITQAQGTDARDAMGWPCLHCGKARTSHRYEGYACPTESGLWADRDYAPNLTPRRIDTLRYTPAERAIAAAMAAVEALPADVRLTDAVVLLGKAKDRVADFVDGVA